jgi:hypothetical protein
MDCGPSARDLAWPAKSARGTARPEGLLLARPVLASLSMPPNSVEWLSNTPSKTAEIAMLIIVLVLAFVVVYGALRSPNPAGYALQVLRELREWFRRR